MIQFQCPKCGQQFTLPQPANQVTCPICGEKFNVATTIPPQPQQPPQYGPQQPPQYGPQQQQTQYGPQQQQYGQQQPQYGQQPQYAYGPAQPGIFDPGPSGKSRGVAGLLAIILGYLGVHYFYLGHTTAGLLSIALSFVTCGIWPIVMLIQGVIMLTMDQATFEQKYVYTQSTLPLF